MFQKSMRFVVVATTLMAGCQTSETNSLNGQNVRPVSFSSLPINLPEEDFHSLRDLEDAAMESELASMLRNNPKWRKLIEEKRMAVGLVDLKDPYRIRYAAVNGDDMMYAASLPKIAILLAAVDAFDKGEVEESTENLDHLNKMISVSSNTSATYFIDLLGYDKIESVLTDPKYGLYDEAYGGGLWVGKRYAAEGKRHPDPMMGLSHAATVSQVCRFYYLMSMGKFVSPERSKQMLAFMDDPGLHHKFVNTLDKIAPNAKLYRKSGSWRSYHCDSVLVWGSGHRKYILVALVDDPDGEAVIRSLVRPVENVLRSSHTAVRQ
jgi:beta-lactamase class A